MTDQVCSLSSNGSLADVIDTTATEYFFQVDSSGGNAGSYLQVTVDGSAVAFPGGTVSVSAGASVTVNITIGDNCTFTNIVIDGEDVTDAYTDGTYTFDDVENNHFITVSGEVLPFVKVAYFVGPASLASPPGGDTAAVCNVMPSDIITNIYSTVYTVPVLPNNIPTLTFNVTMDNSTSYDNILDSIETNNGLLTELPTVTDGVFSYTYSVTSDPVQIVLIKLA